MTGSLRRPLLHVNYVARSRYSNESCCPHHESRQSHRDGERRRALATTLCHQSIDPSPVHSPSSSLLRIITGLGAFPFFSFELPTPTPNQARTIGSHCNAILYYSTNPCVIIKRNKENKTQKFANFRHLQHDGISTGIARK